MRTDAQKNEYYRQLAEDYVGQAILRRCRATVHLENRDDELFWDTMLQKYRPGRYNYVYYSLHPDGNNTSGCTQCLQFKNYLSALFFICIDSDYRYLRQEKDIITNKYILQTYTYSWENHYCCAQRIQDCMARKEPSVAHKFDFTQFLSQYSSTVYEPLLLALYMERNQIPGFGQKKINQLTALQYRDGDDTHDGAAAIGRLATKLNTTLPALKVSSGFDFQNEKAYYSALGLNESNAYLHFRGHNLYNIVRSIGKKLCEGLDIDFEYDILLDDLMFGGYWEIDQCTTDIMKL